MPAIPSFRTGPAARWRWTNDFGGGYVYRTGENGNQDEKNNNDTGTLINVDNHIFCKIRFLNRSLPAG
jgi:hypothetical protein